MLDEKFKIMIQETEARRDEEKKLMKKYLGESFKDIDLDLDKYVTQAKQVIAKKNK